MKQYSITFKRTRSDYATVRIMAGNEGAAKRQARRHLEALDEDVDWCDGDAGRMRIYRVEVKP